MLSHPSGTQCVDTYAKSITILITNSFYHGIFPDELKLARVLMSGNDLESLIQFVNSELCLLNTWLKVNKLSLNVNKTYYRIFHRERIKVDNDNSIRMNDSIINSASHLKYLGVIIDSKLNWIPLITYVKNKISKGIGIMFKARDYLNKN